MVPLDTCVINNMELIFLHDPEHSIFGVLKHCIKIIQQIEYIFTEHQLFARRFQNCCKYGDNWTQLSQFLLSSLNLWLKFTGRHHWQEMTLKQILTLCSRCRNSHGFVVCIYTTHAKRKKKNTSIKPENEDTGDVQEQDMDALCFSLSPLLHSHIMTRAWLSHSLKSMAKFISIRTNFLHPKPHL